MPQISAYRLAAVFVVLVMVGSSAAILVTAPRSEVAFLPATSSPSPASGIVAAPGEAALAAGPGVPSSVHPDIAYAITFSESGLAANLSWAVLVGRVSESYFTDGGTDSLTFSEPTGSYSYSITPIAGWQQSNLSYSGTVVVSGAPVTEPTAVYTPVTYAVTFSESGLPALQTWQVTVGGVPLALTTNGTTDSLSILEPNGTYAYSIADVSGWHQSTLPYSGSVLVNGAPVTKATLVYVQVTYSVVFSESGLVSSLVWQVTVNGVLDMLATNGLTDTLTWTGLPNGTYAYSITDLSGWNESTLAYNGNVAVSGGTTTEPTLVYSKVTYTVTFTETGLPASENFQVTLGREVQGVTTDGGNDTLSFLVSNGTYAYTIADVSGWEQSTLPYVGSVLVAGFAVSEPTLVYTQVTYSVIFTESGLPGGTNWSVTFAGIPQNTTGTELTFTEPNGTYSYVLGVVPGFSPSPGFGSKTVNGANTSVGIAFTVVTYTVTFTESGLPGGTSWGVTIGVTTHTSTGSVILFAEPNGTYGYSVGLVPGYSPTSPTGSVLVNGGPASAAVPFTQVKYTITYHESGLPGVGKRWSVAVGGLLESSVGTSISFSVPNGSFAYRVNGPSGYEVSAVLPPSGTVAVNGASVTVLVTFLRGPTYTITFHEVGLRALTSWCVTIDSTTCSTTSNVAFKNLTPGTYSYAIGSFTGMTTVVKLTGVSVGASGSTSVGPGRLFQIRYTYPVTFTESGLPGGTSWKVAAGGVSQTSTGTTIVLDLTNGSYGFAVTHIRGYVASPASGRIMVAGAPLAISIRFSIAPAHEPTLGTVEGPVATWLTRAIAGVRLG